MDCFICRSKSPHTSTNAGSFTISSSHSRLTRYQYLLLWNKGYKCIVGQFDRLGVLRFFKNYIKITLLNNFKTVKSLNNQKSLFNLKFEFCIILKPIYIFCFIVFKCLFMISTILRVIVIAGKEGPIYAVSWSPLGTEFCVVYGFMPAKATLFNLKCEAVFNLGSGSRNSIYYNPHGNNILLHILHSNPNLFYLFISIRITSLPQQWLNKFSFHISLRISWHYVDT